MSSEEKDLIWKFRFYLARDKRGLTKFLKSVAWRDSSEVKQAVEELLPQWTEIDTDDALELLGPGTVDSRVRAFAVKQLSRADDDVCDNRLHYGRRVLLKTLLGTPFISPTTCAGIEVRKRSKRPAIIKVDNQCYLI